MKLRPVDERVLLKPVKEEEQSAGGIIIPDTAKERPQIAEVVELGDDVESNDVKRKPLSQIVKVGDRVLYAKYGGTEVKLDGEEYLLVNRGDILGVLNA